MYIFKKLKSNAMRVLDDILKMKDDFNIDEILTQDAMEDAKMEDFVQSHKIGQGNSIAEDAIRRIMWALEADTLEKCKKQLNTCFKI